MFILYTQKTCAHSKKVLEFAKEKKIDIEERDIADDTHMLELKEYGGDIQTPYLYDSTMGIGMYESELIITYLTEQLRAGEKALSIEVDPPIKEEEVTL